MMPLQYRHYNLPPDFPVIAFLGQCWKNPQEKISFLHFHDCIEIGCCREGKGILHTADGSFPYKKGDLCVIPCYLPHMMQSDADEVSRWEYIFFDPVTLWEEQATEQMQYKKLASMLSGFCPVFSLQKTNAVYEIVQQIFQEFYEKPIFYQNFVRGGLMTLLSKIERMIPETDGKIKKQYGQIVTLFPAIQYISEHFGEDLKIPQLAQLCHLSPTHFRRMFHMVMQLAPLDYCNRIRISNASQKMLYGKQTMKELARECGFLTQSSFHRAFQKYMGMSPTKWKQVYRLCADENAILSPDEIKNVLLFDRWL